MSYDTKEILGALSYNFDGNWERMYKALKEKEILSEEEVENLYQKITTNYIYVTSPNYPSCFISELNCPPIVVYYKGDLSLLTNRDKYHYVGIVGSRGASEYGKNSVRDIVKGLGEDTVIVSGLAKGIDRSAHEAALDNNLKTIAVLGNGIDYIYPSENEDLYKRIVNEGGLILSEYPALVKPQPQQFIHRNRIVAVLSEFLLIAEAYDRSGTSTTVNYALNAGVTVGCIPYPRNCKSLCNRLIKEGAVLIESSIDIIDQLRRK